MTPALLQSPTGLLNDLTVQRRVACVAAIVAGVLARFWLWWCFVGGADAHVWAQHASNILMHGIARTYESVPTFNHPPIMGWLVAFCSYLTGLWQGDLLVFARWLKFPGLVGDLAATALLWRFASPVAAAIYAVSPVAILISGFHGNTDALCAVFIFAGAIAADRERWFTTGALFAAGMNVKLIPLLLVPILLLSVPWRALPRLAVGLALAVVPFIPPALSAARAMWRNILGYTPTADDWGVMAFLRAAQGVPRLGAFEIATPWYAANGRFILAAAIMLFAGWSRFRGGLRVSTQLAVGTALWLILTPGFGMHYLIYAMPLLCLVHAKRAVLWSSVAGAALAVAYWSGMENTAHPLTSWSQLATARPAVLIGVSAWTILCGSVLTLSQEQRYASMPPECR